MIRNVIESHGPESARTSPHTHTDRRLQIVLWSLWTVAVAITALVCWYLDVAEGQSIDVVSVIIYSGLTGTIGLVVLTMIEMWLEPQRFID